MKLLLWDFDGTLGWREGGWTRALLEAITRETGESGFSPEQVRPFLQSGFPWHTPERPHPEINTPQAWWNAIEPLFEHACLNLGLSQQRAGAIARRVRAIYTDPACFRLYDDSLPALVLLAQLGWTHALLSNHVPELSSILSRLGIETIFTRVFNSAQTGYEKPHHEAFRLAFEDFGYPQFNWMIGDSLTADIHGAEAAGLPAILVRKPHPQARYYASDLNKLCELFTQGSFPGNE